jgi:hypothetical protein
MRISVILVLFLTFVAELSQAGPLLSASDMDAIIQKLPEKPSVSSKPIQSQNRSKRTEFKARENQKPSFLTQCQIL